ncbi:putative nucleoside diphosphate kinase 5 [Nymphaea thermarum]|nr:putative nucleoside diphosphate kinase 5 [Nymphaea thermarum]
MVKPDGVVNKYADTIKKIIVESGFDIVREMMVQLDESNATIFYTEHSHKSFFPDLVKYMTSGPVYVMVLEKVNAISEWRNLIGPTDARKARISHPSRHALSFEPCVGLIHKGIVFMVQIHMNLLFMKSSFSLEISWQVSFQSSTNLRPNQTL